MKKKVSILIPDGEGGLALKVLRCLAQVPDIKISILSRKRWSPIRFSRYRSGFLSHNKDSFDKNRLDAILHAANKVGADVIFPVDQDAIQLIAAHKEEVTSVAALPPIATLEQMNTSGDKWLLAKVLQKNNIPLPSTVFYEKNKTNKNDFAHLSFPVVTKPLVGAGGTGINFFANQDELTKYLDTEEGNHKLLIQSFIHGYDIGSAVLCRDGEILAYTIQKGVIPGKKRFEPPASIEFLHQEQVYKIMTNLMRALNWSGIAFVDMRYDEEDKQPKVLEMNPRYWASLLGSYAAGVNFPYLAYLASTNIDFPRPKYHFIRYTYTQKLYSLLLKKWLGGDNTISNVKYTSLPFTLSDPLPEIFQYSSDIFEKLFHKA